MAISIRAAFEQALASTGERRMVVVSQVPVLIAAVNEGGRAALYVRVPLRPEQALGDGRGFSVKTSRNGENDYVQIASVDAGLPALFLKLAEYVVERVESERTVESATVALLQSVEDYRRFVGTRSGRLSESVVRGTFAELCFLDLLIDEGVPALVAVSAWRGPWAKSGLGVHDFTFINGQGVEVKSTRQPPTRVRVSSPAQLVPSDRQIDLLVLPVERQQNGSATAVSFRRHALGIASRLADAGDVAVESWRAALTVLGLDLRDEWYDQFRFVPGEWQRYRVMDGFPSLELSSTHAAVVDIRYSLELSRLTTFLAPLAALLDGLRQA